MVSRFGFGLTQDIFNDVAENIRKTHIPAAEAKGQARVVYPQQV
jgi:hypothetical protein